MNRLARFETEQDGNSCIVRVDGEIDISNTDELAATIRDAMPKEVSALVLDLSRTRYLDSSGIALLLRLAERLRGRRQELRLIVPADSPIRAVLELTGLPKLVATATSIDEPAG